ncbi:MAG TPA: low temperature requirement protein A [Actinomycetota bacterium]|nr:low temperature requirement protein A [Actinomycetota bacterium]
MRDQRIAPAPARRRWRRPMSSRDSTEEHRASTPLELFFDLCFVVAVAQGAAELHHALTEGRVAHGLVGYAMVFFAIWWAWMNFTWFASAYDTDDVLYRMATLVQIAGVLVLAAGVPRAFEGDFVIVTVGYLIMRVALTAQWLRAAREDPPRRTVALRYAAGITAVQAGWVARLALPGAWSAAGFMVLALAELAVPVWAERRGSLRWHPGHIAERYGLFTLIVLGESVAAATTAVQSALDSGQGIGDLLTLAAGGLLIVFSMWWLYFEQHADEWLSTTSLGSFVWGYGHYLIFASAAGVGAGLQVAVDQGTGHAELPTWGAAAAVAVPVALYLLSVWLLHTGAEPRPSPRRVGYPLAAMLALAAIALGEAVLVIGLLLAALVAARVLAATIGRSAERA